MSLADASSITTAGPATKVPSATTEYGYPHGHLGHLTPEEETAFANFKTQLAEQGLYRPGPPAPSHDDTVLLRFLRARRWVQADAVKQFKDTEEWRASVHIDVLYDTIDVDAYDESRQLYPQWTGRRDRRGIPVYLFEIKYLDSKTISRYEKSVNATYSKAPPPQDEAKTPSKLIRLFALYENLTRFVQPLCTQLTDRDHAQTPITLSTNLVDVSGVSLKQFWNLKGHMQIASQLATAHYPETLDRIFVRWAPSRYVCVSSHPNKCLRLSARPPSFRRFGVGSSGGSTPSPCPRFLFCPNTKSSPSCRATLTLRIFQNNTVANWTLNGVRCPTSTPRLRN